VYWFFTVGSLATVLGRTQIKQHFIPHSDREFSVCGIYSAMIDNG
jgi:hypothetical protein